MAARRSVIIVGAGTLGAACVQAFDLRGWTVTLVAPDGPSASAVAAGMLAPAFEAALDQADAARTAVLRAGRDSWPAVSASAGVELIRDGARWSAHDGASAEAGADLRQAMIALGFAVEGSPEAPFTPDDWRLDPRTALQTLAAPAERRRGLVCATGSSGASAWVGFADGERLVADHVVLASGVGRVIGTAVEPAFAAVLPIKGQILTLAGVRPPPEVVRTVGAYIVPMTGGAVVGATMQAGAVDLTVDPAATAGLLEAAARAWPPLRDATDVSAKVGVRGATPDGLPLAGPVGPRLSLALAPRRNGWLLAPLVASVVAAYAAGADPGPYAAALDPLRFGRS